MDVIKYLPPKTKALLDEAKSKGYLTQGDFFIYTDVNSRAAAMDRLIGLGLIKEDKSEGNVRFSYIGE